MATNGFVKLLIDQGILGAEQVADAESHAKQTGDKIANSLVKLGYATDSEVMLALSTYHLSLIHISEPTRPY